MCLQSSLEIVTERGNPMQIENRVMQSYDANIQERGSLEHTNYSEQVRQLQSSSAASGLKEGTVFKGEVLEISGDKVKISMEDHAQLVARLQEGIELGVGDRLLFSVKENNVSQIMIKPLFDSLHSAQTQVMERVLDTAGLSPTEKNFSAVKELMEAGMSVDKGNLVKLLSQSMKFEGTSMQTLAGLNKMDIPVNASNIAQYERYQGYQHQLSGDIRTAADGMAAFVKAFPDGTNGTTLMFAANQILDMFAQKPSIDNKAGNVGAYTPDTLSEILMKQEEQSVTDEWYSVSEQGEAIAEQIAGKGEQAVVDKEVMTTRLNRSKNVTFQTEEQQGLSGKMDVVTEENIQENKNATKNVISLSQITEQTGLAKDEIANLTNLLSKTGISGEQIKNLFQSATSPEELLKNMLHLLASGNKDEHVLRQVFDSNEFKDTLADIIKKNWTLRPKDMKTPKEIDELYDRIVRESKSFERLIANCDGEPKQFEQSFQNMRQNMQFMEQLNHQMIYAQMPLKLTNQNANSELYVYADKRKLAQKKDGIRVMLHLDMAHLGPTDVHVTLTGSNVNARFYFNDQESVDIVVGNMNQLAKQLADRGFSLTNEVVKRQPQESINKVVNEVIDENAERSIKRYTFDART